MSRISEGARTSTGRGRRRCSRRLREPGGAKQVVDAEEGRRWWRGPVFVRSIRLSQLFATPQRVAKQSQLPRNGTVCCSSFRRGAGPWTYLHLLAKQAVTTRQGCCWWRSCSVKCRGKGNTASAVASQVFALATGKVQEGTTDNFGGLTFISF